MLLGETERIRRDAIRQEPTRPYFLFQLHERLEIHSAMHILSGNNLVNAPLHFTLRIGYCCSAGVCM